MKPRRRSDGEATEKRVFDAAVKLFKKRGFEATTMRDIAEAAGMSLGAAYHYFPSKEALVLGYYERIQKDAQARTRAAMAVATSTRDKVLAVIDARLAQVEKDRRLFAVMFRGVADPDSPISVFGKKTAHLRRAGLDEIATAIADEPMPHDLRALMPTVLLGVEMAILLYAMHDDSKKLERTRRLAARGVDLILGLARLGAMPGLEPLRAQLVALAKDAGLGTGVLPSTGE